MQVGSNGSYTDPIRDQNKVESARGCNYLLKKPTDAGIDECTKEKTDTKDLSRMTDSKNALV